MHVAEYLQPFGTTVFAEITRLAIEHDAVNLGQGFPDFEGPEHVKRAAIEAIEAGHSQYAPLAGVPPLTAAIADRFTRAAGFRPDPGGEVTVTAGCTEAIAATLLGLLNPGDDVILFEPFYDSYRACVAMARATPRFVTLTAPDFRIEPSALEAAITPRTRAVLLNTPHNPTGRVFSVAELAAVADLCRRHDLIAITDEVYEELVYDGARHTPLASLEGMRERTVSMSSIGKTFSFTGWKVGWAIAPTGLTAGIRAAHQFLTFAANTPLQHAAAAALRSDDAYFDGLRADYRARRDLLCEALRAAGFRPHVPEGAYFVLADHTTLGFADDVACCSALIERAGVAAIPPSAFYADPEHGRSMVRFAFCKREATIREAADRLASFRPAG